MNPKLLKLWPSSFSSVTPSSKFQSYEIKSPSFWNLKFWRFSLMNIKTGWVLWWWLAKETDQNHLDVPTDVAVVFPQAPFRVTNVPGHASAGIIQLRNCTLASWGSHRWLCYSICIVEVVWLFMFCWTWRSRWRYLYISDVWAFEFHQPIFKKVT